MKRYRCTVFNSDSTFGEPEIALGPMHVPARRVGAIIVHGRSRREAAARAYVRLVGQRRARLLKELNAPAYCIAVESRWRVLARSLARTSNWLGDCFLYDNMAEAFYLRIARLVAAEPFEGYRRTRRLRRLKCLQFFSAN